MRRYEDPELCKFLRTKSMYVAEERGETATPVVDSHTARFWCLKTMGCIGPDDHHVTDELCRDHRACFENGPPV
jgi:hypothetical protein